MRLIAQSKTPEGAIFPINERGGNTTEFWKKGYRSISSHIPGFAGIFFATPHSVCDCSVIIDSFVLGRFGNACP